MTPKKLFFRLVSIGLLVAGWSFAFVHVWNESDLLKRTSTHEVKRFDSILPAWCIAGGFTFVAVMAWRKGEYD